MSVRRWVGAGLALGVGLTLGLQPVESRAAIGAASLEIGAVAEVSPSDCEQPDWSPAYKSVGVPADGRTRELQLTQTGQGGLEQAERVALRAGRLRGQQLGHPSRHRPGLCRGVGRPECVHPVRGHPPQRDGGLLHPVHDRAQAVLVGRAQLRVRPSGRHLCDRRPHGRLLQRRREAGRLDHPPRARRGLHDRRPPRPATERSRRDHHDPLGVRLGVREGVPLPDRHRGARTAAPGRASSRSTTAAAPTTGSRSSSAAPHPPWSRRSASP